MTTTHLSTNSNDALDVLVIGAGQAGLEIGYHLRRSGVNFRVVDAARAIGHVWRIRWDSLRLFTPAQYDSLPGTPFPAPSGTHPTNGRRVASERLPDLVLTAGCSIGHIRAVSVAIPLGVSVA